MECLTDRQNQIVALRCERGLSIDEAANELFRSPQTVKNTCTTIMNRFDVNNFFQICTLYGRSTAPNAVHAVRWEEV